MKKPHENINSIWADTSPWHKEGDKRPIRLVQVIGWGKFEVKFLYEDGTKSQSAIWHFLQWNKKLA